MSHSLRLQAYISACAPKCPSVDRPWREKGADCLPALVQNWSQIVVHDSCVRHVVFGVWFMELLSSSTRLDICLWRLNVEVTSRQNCKHANGISRTKCLVRTLGMPRLMVQGGFPNNQSSI